MNVRSGGRFQVAKIKHEVTKRDAPGKVQVVFSQKETFQTKGRISIPLQGHPFRPCCTGARGGKKVGLTGPVEVQKGHGGPSKLFEFNKGHGGPNKGHGGHEQGQGGANRGHGGQGTQPQFHRPRKGFQPRPLCNGDKKREAARPSRLGRGSKSPALAKGHSPQLFVLRGRIAVHEAQSGRGMAPSLSAEQRGVHPNSVFGQGGTPPCCRSKGVFPLCAKSDPQPNAWRK